VISLRTFTTSARWRFSTKFRILSIFESTKPRSLPTTAKPTTPCFQLSCPSTSAIEMLNSFCVRRIRLFTTPRFPFRERLSWMRSWMIPTPTTILVYSVYSVYSVRISHSDLPFLDGTG